MGELIVRMARSPSATGYLFAASLMVNLLGLASSLYVIQVLNRFVNYGVAATLASLSAGVLIAIIGEYVFRRLRLRLARDIVGDADERLATGVYGLLLTCPAGILEQRPAGERAEVLRGIERAEQALGPANLAALTDIPFSLLFLAALALLSPPLAGVALVFCIGSVILAWTDQRRLARPVSALGGLGARVGVLLGAAASGVDTIRHFRGAGLMMTRWRTVAAEARVLRAAVALGQNDSAALIQALQAVMSASIIAVGAILVVLGQLDVGALIGANLIAVRALAPLNRLVQMGEALRTASQSLAVARRFAEAADVAEGSKQMPGWTGRLEVRALALSYPGTLAPLFGALNFSLEPAGVLVVTGRNGTGKSSLLRLLAGLIGPSAGQVLADGVDLRQLDPDWWRRQVSYLPQEPVFLDATLRQNLQAARPDADEAAMMRCLEFTGLRSFIDRHPSGLDQELSGGGRALAPGLRRRLAMARAMLVDGPLFLLDEPSEGLDREGAEAVYALLIDLAQRGKTLVVVSHDQNILRGARLLLRFDGTEPTLVRWPGAEP